MDALCNYDSGSDAGNDDNVSLVAKYCPLSLMGSEGEVSVSNALVVPSMAMIGNNILTVSENAPISQQNSGIQLGPKNPFLYRVSSDNYQLEPAAVESWSFNEQYKSYQKSGYALDTSSNVVLGDYLAYISDELSFRIPKRAKRETKSGVTFSESELEGESPWLDNSTDNDAINGVAINDISNGLPLTLKNAQKIEAPVVDTPVLYPNEFIVEPDEEEEKWERVNERKLSLVLPPRPPRGSHPITANSIFHGTAEIDYQGRSWAARPTNLKRSDGDHECYIPKKCIKTFQGHTKGVQSIEFIPHTGHLMLSGSMDGKCKIWDVYGDRNVRRTYSGHAEAVRFVLSIHDILVIDIQLSLYFPNEIS